MRKLTHSKYSSNDRLLIVNIREKKLQSREITDCSFFQHTILFSAYVKIQQFYYIRSSEHLQEKRKEYSTFATFLSRFTMNFIFLTLDINSIENYNLDTCLEGIRILKYVPLSVGSAQGDFFIRLPIPFPFHIPRKFFHQTMVLLEKHPNSQYDPILLHSIKRML